MSFAEILFLGVGLAMDAFAVSVCKGLAMSKVNKKYCFVIAIFFGGFQAFMPFLGWLLGSTFANRIQAIDHWIVFILLCYIGVNMISEAIKEAKEKTEVEEMDAPLDLKDLTVLAIATSIDALAAGITLSFLKVSIALAITTIGVVTFAISYGGVYVGNVFGERYKSRSQIVGGVILIIIGLRVLLTHLMGAA